jgi:quercetin dioxygenase-like cupin family protein
MRQPNWKRSWPLGALLIAACLSLACQHALAQDIMTGSGPGRAGSNCRNATDKDNEQTQAVGCWILARVTEEMPSSLVYWHIYGYPSRAAAEAVKGTNGAVIEGLGKIWLLSVGEADWKPAPDAVPVAKIGPLLVNAGEKYTAQYMVAVFTPGMTTPVHRHPGPEAWYTLSGEVCLETPDGKRMGRSGESTIVPEGPPMKLTATGTEKRRSLVLILHKSSQPSGIQATDWKPKGLCK